MKYESFYNEKAAQKNDDFVQRIAVGPKNNAVSDAVDKIMGRIFNGRTTYARCLAFATLFLEMVFLNGKQLHFSIQKVRKSMKIGSHIFQCRLKHKN